MSPAELSGYVTAVLMLAFGVITIWAWSARNQPRFRDAAQLPLRDEPAHGERP